VARAYWSLFDHDGIQPGDAKFARRLLAEWPDGIDIRDMAGQDPTDDVSLSKDESAIAAWAETILSYHTFVETIFDGERLLPLNEARNWRLADQVAQLRQEISSLKEKNTSLSSELTGASDSFDTLHHKRKTSIYKFILGVAKSEFNYNPNYRGNSASAIRSSIQRGGFDLDETPILRILEAAVDHLE
jgi:hypothetical protein